jgi:hypothetical protein
MVRGATFDCDVAVAAAVEDLLDALVLLEWEPHPVKPIPKAAMAIATPLIAVVRFTEIAPVDLAARGGLTQEQRTPIASARNLRVSADMLRSGRPHAG